ncbi:MAG TPA: cupredoxin domain-containing protein [Dehalococcoidia bacterium]|nr:cupredoxin domain-containing protein [Dehalococcoidia bacterium]
MNTRKQVLVMVTLLMLGLLGIAAYSAWDPDRNIEAQEHFNEKVAKRGAILFARNCRLCHGDVGEGGALGGRLAAAPALNRPDLQGFTDSKATLAADISETDTTIRVSSGTAFATAKVILIDEERMNLKRVDGNNLTVERGAAGTAPAPHFRDAPILLLDPAYLTSQQRMITNTIACGRVGTAMPTWSQDHGGPLSDEQIRQLTVLISEGHWELVAEEVDIEDAVGAHLTREIDDTTISLPVSDVSFFTQGEALRIGEERMLITGVPKLSPLEKDKSGIIGVTRGALGSIPAPHTPDEEIFRFPLAPDSPSIVQQSCGQFARPAPPSRAPGPQACADPCQTVEVTAQGVAFNVREIRVPAGGNIRIRFTNNDTGVDHNIAVYQSSTNLQPVAPGAVGAIFPGPGVDEVVFAKPPPGSYFFRCDVHPTTMTGTFVVQ